jgi:tetratricopeptide (TPR) repeat protein
MSIGTAQAHAWLSDAHAALGRFDDAIAGRRQEIDIYKTLLRRKPGGDDVTQFYLVAQKALSQLALAKGDLADARTRAEEAVTFAGTLLALDPNNKLWSEMACAAHLELGEALFFTDDLPGATRAARQARHLAEALVGADPSVRNWQVQHLGRTELLEARLAARQGDRRGALADAQAILRRLEPWRDDNGKTSAVPRIFGTASLLAGDQFRALGASGDAMRAWRDALASFEHAANSRIEPLSAVPLGRILLRVGRREEAEQLAARLDALGYRHPDFLLLQQELQADPPIASVAARP